MPEILPLALTAAVDPALLAVVALLLVREGGDRRLLVFTAGGIGAGFAVGAAILLGLGVWFTVPSGDSPPPWLEIVVGAVLLAVAVALATGLDARIGAVLRSHRHVPRRAADDAGKERTPSRLRRAADSEALWPIFIAGVLWGAVPDALYLAALALLAKSGDPVFVAQVGSAAIFQVVAYTLAYSCR